MGRTKKLLRPSRHRTKSRHAATACAVGTCTSAVPFSSCLAMHSLKAKLISRISSARKAHLSFYDAFCVDDKDRTISSCGSFSMNSSKSACEQLRSTSLYSRKQEASARALLDCTPILFEGLHDVHPRLLAKVAPMPPTRARLVEGTSATQTC